MTKTPIRIRRYKSAGHALETRVFAREIHETFCAHKGCKFFGKPAAQGVCHTRLRGIDMKYLERVEKHATSLINDMRESRSRAKMTPQQYITFLERHMSCQWMNQEFNLDELISLRAKLAVAKLTI